ncbi:hypothetical protein B9T24_14075 [Acinetobacter sp. ANC 4654]|uniref:hypothetical protein n=1 Tax=Acinetobacter sp. ANC 4654 TaxID=1977872 RepID=UPI000A3533A3|nr:hypothetical protein [Acinetobacter sp. ANC 4654]OTG93593.1 hypothetical protein B9T24_14075 [Acinetobacter sp. ANC 4654]
MWKNIAKELATELKEVTERFVIALQQNDLEVCRSLSFQAQTKLTEMFRELRNSQDHNEIPNKLGKNSSLGYFQEADSNCDEFSIFKTQRSFFNRNEELTLRDCANAVFHCKQRDYYVDPDGTHWLMYITDRKQLVIIDIKKVCDVIIANI